MDTTLENRGSTTVAGSICPAEQETEIKINVALEEQFILYCKSLFAFYWCCHVFEISLFFWIVVIRFGSFHNCGFSEGCVQHNDWGNWGYGWHKVQFCWLCYSPSAFLLLMMILIVIEWLSVFPSLFRCSELLHLAVLHPRKLSVYSVSGNTNTNKQLNALSHVVFESAYQLLFSDLIFSVYMQALLGM